jgi:hypothetical protein
VDRRIGELREFLKEENLEENTLLLFLTDNGTSGGEPVYNANMRGRKGSAYEGGHRVPCFLYWASDTLALNREINEVTSVMDLLPTFVDLCNLELERPIGFHGQSLKPLLFPGAGKWENRSILVETQRVVTPIKWRNCVLMNKKWRLINGKELYDMDKDFSQMNDVAGQFPEIVERLRNDYEEIWADISRRDDEYARPVIGTEFAPVTTLSGMDWHDFIVSQQNVRRATISNGSWPIKIAKPGEYIFALRRWPRESKLQLGAATPEVKSADNDISFKRWGGKPAGKALDIYKAGIRVNDIEMEKEADPSKDRVEFRIELDEGDAELKTWFYTTAGDTLGAYYVDISIRGEM